MGLIPEALPNFALDPAVTALGPALPSALTTLSSQWAQLASQLRSAFGAYDSQISVLGTDVFSGTAAGAMKRSLDTFAQGGKRVADETLALSAWAVLRDANSSHPGRLHDSAQNSGEYRRQRRVTLLAASDRQSGGSRRTVMP